MHDHEFEVLKVRASVAPGSADWPPGDVQVSIAGDRPSIKGELHWAALHGAVAEARERTMKTLGAMSGIDDDKSLSLDGKREAKRGAAQKALADMERSQALVKAREVVEKMVAKWNKELAPPPVDPTVAAEIRAHIARLRDGDRLPFVIKHIADAGPAVIQGPSFLSGITLAEQDIIRRQYETSRNPKAAEAKTKAMDALAHCEAGWRNASSTIRSSGGLENTGKGAAA